MDKDGKKQKASAGGRASASKEQVAPIGRPASLRTLDKTKQKAKPKAQEEEKTIVVDREKNAEIRRQIKQQRQAKAIQRSTGVLMRIPRQGDKGSDSESEAGSELEGFHNAGHVAAPALQRHESQHIVISDASTMTGSTNTSTSSTFTVDSLDSSIHKYREEFEDFKCKMRIFGESLNLCKCIANDFKGKLSYMEGKLHGLEKRQKINKVDT